MFDLERLVRQNIRDLNPYSSARHDFTGRAEVYLDANENALGSPAGSDLNRYPDPTQRLVRERLAELYDVPARSIFVGNGSDEAIDVLYRIFCVPGQDIVVTCPPTYGMYAVYAQINDVNVAEVPLDDEFDLDVASIREASSEKSKLLFICSPNNPSGNASSRDRVLDIVAAFPGIVVVDEAYIDFSDSVSLAAELDRFPNLVILRTCSKAWGMAALRIGAALASPEIVALMDAVKPPYNVSGCAQEAALKGLLQVEQVGEWIKTLKNERERVARHLTELGIVEKVFPSDANFLLAKFDDAASVYGSLVERGVVVRDRSQVPQCGGCLRITIGTPDENDQLLTILEEINL